MLACFTRFCVVYGSGIPDSFVFTKKIAFFRFETGFARC